jgi:MFS family permease
VRRTLAKMVFGHLFLHACMAGMRLAMPLWALHLGYSAAAVGVLLALFALVQVIISVPAGRFVDRHGLHTPMRIAVLVSVLGAMLCAAWPSYPVLCLGALATGGATGFASIALQRHVGRMAAPGAPLREAFSWLSVGPAISNFVGPLLAGLLIDHAGNIAADEQGFRIAFGVMACLPIITWWAMLAVRELPRIPASTGQDKLPAWDLLRGAAMRRLMVINWLLSSCWDVHTFVVPLLGHQRGLSASAIGTILGVFALAATTVRLILPWFAKRLSERKVVAFAMVSTCVLFMLYPLMPSALGMGACSMLLGFVLGAVQPMIMSTLHHITPVHRQGEAIGVRLVVINLSSVLMPLVFGTAGAAVGVAAIFWAVGTMVGAGSPFALRLGRG